MTTFAVPRDELSKSEPCVPPTPTEPTYPSLEFSKKHVDILKQLLGGKLPRKGDEIKATVVLTVKFVSEGPEDWDNRICMSLQSMDGIGSMEIEEEDEKGEPAGKGYKKA